MTEKDVKKAVNKAHTLDEASQTLRASAKKKWNRAMVLGGGAFLILFVLAVSGLFYQNYISIQSKNHIDCIVKLLATPSKSGQTRRIVNLSTCQIKVSP